MTQQQQQHELRVLRFVACHKGAEEVQRGRCRGGRGKLGYALLLIYWRRCCCCFYWYCCWECCCCLCCCLLLLLLLRFGIVCVFGTVNPILPLFMRQHEWRALALGMHDDHVYVAGSRPSCSSLPLLVVTNGPHVWVQVTSPFATKTLPAYLQTALPFLPLSPWQDNGIGKRDHVMRREIFAISSCARHIGKTIFQLNSKNASAAVVVGVERALVILLYLLGIVWKGILK